MKTIMSIPLTSSNVYACLTGRQAPGSFITIKNKLYNDENYVLHFTCCSFIAGSCL